MTRTIRGAAIALLMLVSLAFSTLAAPQSPAQSSAGATTDGLTLLDEGSAVYYGPRWDNGGWDQIVQRHIDWGQAPDRFVYRTDGQWCVNPDYGFGDILTLRNPQTGVTTTCTIGDAVAPQDVANWRRHAVIEVSYTLFTRLGLESGNDVQVWFMPNG